ncbi:MAG: long-subunit fatty acid transport protein [Rhodothermales bacterium]|jgi:long-subunit fatty acid transport protein
MGELRRYDTRPSTVLPDSTSMKAKSLPIALVAFALSLGGLLAPAAVAQTGADAYRISKRLPLSSPILIGSAGVGAAGRGDLADIFRNPAGLGLLDRGAFSLSLNTTSVQDDAIFSTVGGPSSASTSELNTTQLGDLSYAYKFPTSQGSMVLGFGVSQVSSFQRSLRFDGENGLNSLTDFLMPLSNEFSLVEDGGETFPEFSRPLSFIGFETYAIDLNADAVAAGDAVPFSPAVSFGRVQQSGLVSEEGSVQEFALAGAMEAAEGVMVGVSLNVPFGRYQYTRILDEDDVFNDNDGTNGTTDFDYLTFTESFESRLVGINLRAGVSAEVSDNVRVGLSVETPTYYSISEDFDTTLLTGFDNGDSYAYGDAFDEDEGRGSFDYDLRSPWRLEAGVAFDSGPFSLSGDLEFVDWSQMELDSRDFSFAEQNLDIRRSFESTVNVRIAAEYRMDKFQLRGGFAGYPDARTSSAGLDRDRGVVSLGFSYLVNRQFAFDFGVMAEVFEDQYSPYAEVDNAPLVSEELTRGYVSLGVRMGL